MAVSQACKLQMTYFPAGRTITDEAWVVSVWLPGSGTRVWRHISVNKRVTAAEGRQGCGLQREDSVPGDEA